MWWIGLMDDWEPEPMRFVSLMLVLTVFAVLYCNFASGEEQESVSNFVVSSEAIRSLL